MAKAKGSATGKPAIDHVVKRTHVGGLRPKTSTMNKSYRRGFKPNRGQGR